MSKNLFFGFTIAFFLTACSAGQNQDPGITGNISGANNKTVYLKKFAGSKWATVDSATVDESGSFFIPMSSDMALDYYSLSMTGEDDQLILLTDSSETIVIEAEAENLDTPDKLEGSENSRILKDFQAQIKDYARQADSLQQAFQDPNTSAERKAQIRSDFTKVISEKNEYARNFIDQHLPNPAALSGLSQLNMATDIAYFDKVQEQLKDDFGHSNYYQMIGTQIASYKKQEKLKASGQVKRQEKNSKYSEGMMAPNIEMPDPEGKMRSLEELRGKVVLIDFWAAWCGPCRRENPNLVRTYQKYKDDGFEVFSVSFDKTKDRWVQAIEQDNLTWDYHVSDLQGWQNAAGQQYGISSIPHTILLDKKGEIIATKLRGAALENKLKEVFGH